jgi:NAD(P)H-hydrate epimerase
MFLSRDEVRELDRRAIEKFGIPGLVLMENAGRGTAELLLSLGVDGPVVICCGKGNNGGDGFVIARHLARVGVAVRVLLFARPEELSGDAAVNFASLSHCGVPVTVPTAAVAPGDLNGAAWIVDALFGYGLSGPVRAPFPEVVAAINASPARVLAVDIPSGLDCDTGQPLGSAVRAHHTATMLALKRGFAQPDAQSYLGRVHLIDIGVSLERLRMN